MDHSGLGRVFPYTASNGSPLPALSPVDASVWRYAGVQEDTHKKCYGTTPPVDELPQSTIIQNIDHHWVLNGDSSKRAESIWGSQQVMSTSPQSTLVGMTNWEVLSPSPGSNGDLSSGLSSPPTPAAAVPLPGEEDNALDLLYAELMRLKMEDEIRRKKQVLQVLQLQQQQDHQQLWEVRQRPPSHSSNDAHTMRRPSTQSNAGLASVPNSFHKGSDYSKGFSFHTKLKRDNENPGVQSRKQINEISSPKRTGWIAELDDGTNRHPSRAPKYFGWARSVSSVPSLSKNTTARGSGMRAVFLEVPGARECSGTGVFLPRRAGSGPDRKPANWKPTCSTVLLPSRIVQALNLRMDALSCSPTQPSSTLQRESSVHAHLTETNSRQQMRKMVYNSETERAFRANSSWSSEEEDTGLDVCLPKEWTY